MYAIVDIAGKQVRVQEKQILKVPLLSVENGKKVEFENVLFFNDGNKKAEVGQPFVKGVKVAATVLEHGKDKKVIVFKKKRRKGYQVKNGHRQQYTMIQIDKIGAAKKAAAPKAEKKEAPAAKTVEKKETAPKTAKKPAAAPKKTAEKKEAASKKTVKKPAAAPKKTAEKKEA
jgi:large subunit ribosomal protein L21